MFKKTLNTKKIHENNDFCLLGRNIIFMQKLWSINDGHSISWTL